MKPIVYTSTVCSGCEKVKAWFKDRDVEFEERKGSEHGTYLMTQGVFGLPATFWGGIWIIDYRPKALQEIYEISNKKEEESI